MNGKEKCEILKAIRQNIAEMNGIKYEPKPCTHEGDCYGVCPQCEKEAELLMGELRRKEAAGSPIRIDAESLNAFESLAMSSIEDEDDYQLLGDLAPEDDRITECEMGIICPPSEKENNDEQEELK